MSVMRVLLVLRPEFLLEELSRPLGLDEYCQEAARRVRWRSLYGCHEGRFRIRFRFDCYYDGGIGCQKVDP